MRKRLLVVEDHSDTLEMLCILLDRSGYETVGVGSKAAALAACDAGDFDLLISDIQLPDGNGHELLEELSTHCKIKAIAFTGLGYDSDIARSQAAGFARHIVKPAQFETLLESIRQVLNEEHQAVSQA